MNVKRTNRVDVNQSSLEELIAVPRLNTAAAALIYENRPYERLDDLIEIKGIGPRLLDLLRPYLKISPVDINTASKEKLIAIPRLSPTLADRIIDGRPYESLEEIKKLQGIGIRLHSHLQPYLEISPRDAQEREPAIILDTEGFEEPKKPLDRGYETIEPPPGVDDEEILVAVGETSQSIFTPVEQPEEEASVRQERDRLDDKSIFSRAIQIIAPERTAPSTATEIPKKTPGQTEMLAWILGGSVLTLILAVIFSLGILGLVNGGLQFKSKQEAELETRSLQDKIEELNILAGDLQEDISSLRTRMDDLENLSGRISEVESENETLHTELDDLSEQVVDFQGQVTQFSEQLDQILGTSNSFKDFLEGVYSLLDEILPISGP